MLVQWLSALSVLLVFFCNNSCFTTFMSKYNNDDGDDKNDEQQTRRSTTSPSWVLLQDLVSEWAPCIVRIPAAAAVSFLRGRESGNAAFPQYVAQQVPQSGQTELRLLPTVAECTDCTESDSRSQTPQMRRSFAAPVARDLSAADSVSRVQLARSESKSDIHSASLTCALHKATAVSILICSN